MSSATRFAVVAAFVFAATAAVNFYRAHVTLESCHLSREVDGGHALRKLAGTADRSTSALTAIKAVQQEAVDHRFHSASVLAVSEYNAALAFPVDSVPDPNPSKTVYDQRDPVDKNGDWTEVISHMPVGSVVSVTFTNSGYKELMTNCKFHVH